MSRFDLIVFDLDGTLVDSRRDIADSANALLVACGAAPLPEATIGRMVGDGAAVLVRRAFEAARVPPPADALDRFLEIYGRQLLVHTRPYPDVDRVLTELGARASLALVTNKPGEATRRVLDGLDLLRHFAGDRIVAGDGPFPRKPDPSGLQHVMAASGAAASRTMLVGDSAIDWRTGQRASARVCVARYGFGFDGFPVAELGADDLTIDAPAELLILL